MNAPLLPSDMPPARRLCHELLIADGFMSAHGLLGRVSSYPNAPVAPMIEALLVLKGAGYLETSGGAGPRMLWRWKGPHSLDRIGPITWETLEQKVCKALGIEQAPAVPPPSAGAEPQPEPAKPPEPAPPAPRPPEPPSAHEEIMRVLTEADTRLTKPEILERIGPGRSVASIASKLSDLKMRRSIFCSETWEYALNSRKDLPPSRRPMNGQLQPPPALTVAQEPVTRVPVESEPPASTSALGSQAGPSAPESEPAGGSAQILSAQAQITELAVFLDTPAERAADAPKGAEGSELVSALPSLPSPAAEPELTQSEKFELAINLPENLQVRAQWETIAIPIPGKWPAKIELPPGFDQDDFDYFCQVFELYMHRRGFKVFADQ